MQRVKTMPAHTNRVRGRDGVNRYYHRLPGFPNLRLPDLADPGFAAAHAAAEARAGKHSTTIAITPNQQRRRASSWRCLR